MGAACCRGPGGHPGARVLQHRGLLPLARRPPCSVLVCAARRQAAEPHPDSQSCQEPPAVPPAPASAQARAPPGHPFPPLALLQTQRRRSLHLARWKTRGEDRAKVKEVTEQGLYLFNKKIASLKK